jgi:dihydrofolate reductase
MMAGRKLVLKMSVSLDGFVCGPNGEFDWVFRSSGPDSRAWVSDILRGADAHLMGSRSFYDMASFWPFSDLPLAAPMNDIPKIMCSSKGLDRSRLDRVTQALASAPDSSALKSWAEPTVLTGDLAEEINRLKAQPGNYILAHGGARFSQSLAAAGLVDEYRLGIHPVVLGQGQPLFAKLGTPADLQLVSATTFSTGALGVVYRPAD